MLLSSERHCDYREKLHVDHFCELKGSTQDNQNSLLIQVACVICLDDHGEDERNLVYVAVSRAKKCLQLNSTILNILGYRKVSHTA